MLYQTFIFPPLSRDVTSNSSTRGNAPSASNSAQVLDPSISAGLTYTSCGTGVYSCVPGTSSFVVEQSAAILALLAFFRRSRLNSVTTMNPMMIITASVIPTTNPTIEPELVSSLLFLGPSVSGVVDGLGTCPGGAEDVAKAREEDDSVVVIFLT
jgi:hypothetical protein